MDHVKRALGQTHVMWVAFMIFFKHTVNYVYIYTMLLKSTRALHCQKYNWLIVLQQPDDFCCLCWGRKSKIHPDGISFTFRVMCTFNWIIARILLFWSTPNNVQSMMVYWTQTKESMNKKYFISVSQSIRTFDCP